MLQRNTFDINGTQSFSDLLRREMNVMPDAAIHGSDGAVMTYAELQERSDTIRSTLPGPGQRAEESIAICAAKTHDCLAAVLAVLSTGRAYAPLDPTHPVARLTTILDDLNPSALIVDATTEALLKPWAYATGTPVIDLDLIADRDPSVAALPVVSVQQDLAALLHTSGSTGKPKRVEIEAHALNVFQDWVIDELSLRIDDCVMSHAPFAFDLSFLDIYASLMSGSGLVLADSKTARNGARLCELIKQAGVTVWHSAPSALKLLAESAGDKVMPTMRCVLFAGEPMPARVLQRLFRIFPNARFLNIYGCTETNDTFFFEVPRANTPDPLPLGRKLPYVEYLLTDTDGAEIDGEGEGELWVSCPTMMRGYSDPELTARVMVHRDGRTYYRSGDLVRRAANGVIHFVGRVDTVVKLSGVRVDLNEVDFALASHPGVDEALSFVTYTSDGTVLNAWVTSHCDELNSLDLRLHLMKTLPTPAIPRNFTVSLLPVPRNSNGKACRRLLAQTCDSAVK